MITATVERTRFNPEFTVKVDRLVNRGQWWGETYLLSVQIGNAWSYQFVIEAYSMLDALDEFVDSKYGHMITIDARDLADYHEDDIIHAGNDCKPVLQDGYWSIHPCKVNYFVKPDSI